MSDINIFIKAEKQQLYLMSDSNSETSIDIDDSSDILDSSSSDSNNDSFILMIIELLRHLDKLNNMCYLAPWIYTVSDE